MIRACIVGVTGYTGIELLRLLQFHPEVKLTHVFTESYVGEEIANIYPHLKNLVLLNGEKINIKSILNDSDVVFISLPHGHAVEIAKPLLDAGKKIIDLGADFRLKKQSDYLQWYKTEPASQELLNQSVYGLPEIGNRKIIAQSSLIANPGCYPTASILGCYPLLKNNLIQLDDCLFDAKSGVSGAGRTLSLKSHFCEATENISAYQIAGAHRHTPEIEQELSSICNQAIQIQFTPHLVPIIRGMLVTGYFKLKQKMSSENMYEIFQNAYKDEPFIRICEPHKLPNIKNVHGTNYCDIGFDIDSRINRITVVSVIDNLLKGASGQALQNMNLMYRFPETMGFSTNTAIYP